MMCTVFAKFVVHQGRGDELIAAFAEMWEQVNGEAGTLQYVLNRSAKDPDVFWMTEVYDEKASLAAHRGSETMARLWEAILELTIESRREVLVGQPVCQK
jgi:quinol monooxygenase YgiN